VSRGAKIALGLTGLVVGLNVALSLLHSLLGGTPGGPTSSSYSTGAAGVAAYASLLARAGHPVARLRTRPAASHLDPRTTVVLLDPASNLAATDAAALRRFVSAGGDLVLGGSGGDWLARIVPDAPEWSSAGVGASAGTLVPDPALAGVQRVESPGPGSWHGGSALPLLGTSGASLLALAEVGRGRIWLLANTAPLHNDELAEADDARLGLAIAGGGGRGVTFLESYHGFGPASGYAAIPPRWWVAFGLLLGSALTLMAASGRRLGPPQARERSLPPPRREYVESLAGILARTRPRGQAAEPLRRRLRAAVAERAGLDAAASDEQLRAAAERLGVDADAAALLTRRASTDTEVVSLGRTLVRVRRQSGP
jgi:hypothetical protein